ncbi:hypothetical protein BMF94_6032 [Rhodotorula taiwanensis]|uniref:Uncharacterized protein n=1 Tax=Rhodotorula taiwanensis TaxID=741276 RepID=A0A2S5B2F0_9BASI|nr:hypothetical protein BMF94_6032 [Rhodotorula taiwanensis]
MSYSDRELDDRGQLEDKLRRLRAAATRHEDHWVIHTVDQMSVDIYAAPKFAYLKWQIDDTLLYYRLLARRPRVGVESAPPQKYYGELWKAMRAFAPDRVRAHPRPERYRTGVQYSRLQADLKDVIEAAADRVLAEDRVHLVTQARSDLIDLAKASVRACTLMPSLMHGDLLAISREQPISEAEEALSTHNDITHALNGRPHLDYRFLYWRNHLILGIFNCPWAESEGSDSEA